MPQVPLNKLQNKISNKKRRFGMPACQFEKYNEM